MSEKISSKRIQEFRNVSRQYSDMSVLMHEAIARSIGLSGTDHKYLGLMIQQGEMTAGEISEMTGLTTGAVTGLIDRLEKKKLVKRYYDKDDRRKVIIVPDARNTAKLLEPAFAELQKKTAALIASFSEKEIEVIERYFSEAASIMKDITDNLNNS